MVNKGLFLKLALIVTILCLVVPLFSYGCNSNTSTTTQTSTASSTTTPSTTQITRGGTLRIGAADDAQNAGYPAVSVKDVDFRHTAPCLEALGYYNAEGNVVPFLAESWQEDSVAKTITITLKKGIKFHDDTDFNAEAVKWNFQQFIDNERSEFTGLTSMDVIDNYTVRLNFSVWNNSFISQFPFVSQMISPTACQKNGKDWALVNPIGTGPFKFVSWQRDVKISYTKFDGYWQEGKPYLDAIEILEIADATVRLASFQKGEVDIIVGIQEQPTDLIDLQASGKYDVRTLSPIGAGPLGLCGDSGNPDSPFSKLQVRQAINYAIDTQAIVDNVLHGLGTTCSQFGQPGYWGYNDAVKITPYDPAKARSLLAEAGYPDGFKTTILLETQSQVDWLTAVQSYLKDVGIEATLDVGGTRFPDAILNKGWTGLILIICKGGADIAPYMPNTFSRNGFIWSKSLLKNDELEQGCTDGLSATDFATKQTAIQNMMYLIFDKYNLITPVYQQVVGCAVYPSVHGDGLYVIDDSQWTPANAYISK
jgi:peptide/nickel transport system substrate-binding protein